MAYSYRSTSLLPGSDTYNEVQDEIKRQEKQERVKQLNEDSITTRAELKIIREQRDKQEQQLRERQAQQEQQLRKQQARFEQQELQKYRQQIKQELQQLQPHTHPEPSFFTNVGNSVRRCLTATGKCLEEPEIIKQRELEEKMRRKERSEQEDRDYLDEYDREHPPSNWDDDLEEDKREYRERKAIKMEELKKAYSNAIRNLEIAKQAAAIVDRDEASRIEAGGWELHRVRRNLADATKAAKAAAAEVVAAEVAEAELERSNKQREKYGYHRYQGGRKTKKIKHRHHKKSLRHRKKSLRHRKKSLRHRKKSIRHRKKSIRHRKKSMKHHNKY
jgi:hypothetical protein